MSKHSLDNVDFMRESLRDDDGFVTLTTTNECKSDLKRIETLNEDSSDTSSTDFVDTNELTSKKLKDIISLAVKKGIFLSPALIDKLTQADFDYESFIENLSKNQNLLYVDESVFENRNILNLSDLNWFDFDKAIVEKEVNDNPKMYDSFLEMLKNKNQVLHRKLLKDEHNFFFNNISNLSVKTFEGIDTSVVEPDRSGLNATKYTTNKTVTKNSSNLKYCEQLSNTNVIVNASKTISRNTKPNNPTRNSSDNATSGYKDLPSNVEVLQSYTSLDKKLDVKNFTNYYRQRLKTFVRMLSTRSELQGLKSISKVKGETEVSIMGLISNIVDVKNAIFLDVEDTTGVIRVIVSKDNRELYNIASELVLDQAIGVTGFLKNKVIYAKNIIEPGVPNNIPIKKAKQDVNLAIISDLHIGSKLFLEKEFLKFISWINGDYENETHRDMGLRTKYLVIAGDLVDGVGVYPNQKDELKITSIKKQYDYAAYLLSQIRKDVTIIIAPGNHDAVRLAEPQPPLDENFAKALYELDNVIHISNPAMLRIHKVGDFPGFKVLIYHGYSFDYYIRNIDCLRNNGGFDRFDLVMKFLLNKRHLSPSHGGTLFVPDPNKDPLIIEEIPDIFIVGHNHRPNVNVFNNILLVSGGTWQLKTPFQEKIGHDPLPGRVPVFNLKNRKINLLRFVE